MGVDYRAAIFIGLPRGDVANQELLSKLLDDDSIEVCPPHYDGGSEDHAIVGFELAGSDTYSPREFNFDEAAAAELKNKFLALIGETAKMYISPYGY